MRGLAAVDSQKVFKLYRLTRSPPFQLSSARAVQFSMWNAPEHGASPAPKPTLNNVLAFNVAVLIKKGKSPRLSALFVDVESEKQLWLICNEQSVNSNITEPRFDLTSNDSEFDQGGTVLPEIGSSSSTQFEREVVNSRRCFRGSTRAVVRRVPMLGPLAWRSRFYTHSENGQWSQRLMMKNPRFGRFPIWRKPLMTASLRVLEDALFRPSFSTTILTTTSRT